MHVRQAALFGILVCPAHEELKDHQADGLAYPEPQRFRRQASVRGLHALFVHDAIEAAERGRVGPLLARQLGLEAALCPQRYCWHSWKNATHMPAISWQLTDDVERGVEACGEHAHAAAQHAILPVDPWLAPLVHTS